MMIVKDNDLMMVMMRIGGDGSLRMMIVESGSRYGMWSEMVGINRADGRRG